jgi:hypothetical protein
MLADRYITDREFPDKAIDIMDEVGARCQINVTVPEIIEKLKEEANQIKDRKVEVVRSQKYEEAAELRDMERKVLARLQEEKDKFEKDRLTNKKEVTEEMVYEVVSQMTKIPISKLSQSESDSLINLEESLTKAVIGLLPEGLETHLLLANLLADAAILFFQALLLSLLFLEIRKYENEDNRETTKEKSEEEPPHRGATLRRSNGGNDGAKYQAKKKHFHVSIYLNIENHATPN